MYASCRCVGWQACRTRAHKAYRAVSKQHRGFFTILACRQAALPSDAGSKRGDSSCGEDAAKHKPVTSKWRKRQNLYARNGFDSSYMIVDPVTGSAEIVERDTKARDKQASRTLPSIQLPSWFDDCVLWPDHQVGTSKYPFKKRIISLPSKDSSVAGISFVQEADNNFHHQTCKDEVLPSERMWLDPLVFAEIDGVIRTSLELPPSKDKDTPLSVRSTVSLHCPLEGCMPLLGDIVEHIAATQDSGILRLSAQDLAELGGNYVCPDAGLDVSLQTLPFDAYSETIEESVESDESADEEDTTEEEDDRERSQNMQTAAMVLQPTLIPMHGGSVEDILKNLTAAFSPTGLGIGTDSKKHTKGTEKGEEEVDVEPLMDEALLDKFLNALIDAAWSRRAQGADAATKPRRRLVVCLEDMIRISQTAIGIELVERLAQVIRRRRMENGENIVLVGISIDKDLLSSADAGRTIQWETDHSIWRTFIVMPHSADGSVITSQEQCLRQLHAQRILNINIRNWYMVLSLMAPALAPSRHQILGSLNNEIGSALGFTKTFLPRDEIQRLATTSIARALSQKRKTVGLDDLVRAVDDSRVMDATRHARLQSLRNFEASSSTKGVFGPKDPLDAFFPSLDPQKPISLAGLDPQPVGLFDISSRLRSLQREADRYEKRLISGVILPERINTTFEDVHVARSTVEAVRDLTSLSLQRPDAFKYGVLAKNTLSGVLLYGPPGTGKTMLAKAVAKESKAAVLTVTGSDVNQMWVGESEKTVKAIFTLARKLAPCVVFIDEADALLASRGSDGRGGRPNHRDTINQFLLEWDGMNESGVFLMVATNRPFDLDDAVLRRLPRRVLVDLPDKDDREAILRIHLKGETISNDVDISELAEQTPYYSGSDLKNVVVSAALAAVKDELEAKKKADAQGEPYQFPEKRTLQKVHFVNAIGEISASVTGDMSSLGQIKKFDEQYGDRKGRRKKNPYGFLKVEEREEYARVRA
ncbi:uncharacterized protein PV09_02655 [Verruconis gallopava]|uniref:AAA+ ATPase domain-containing protein n=1 Tax=Verruconis gallopava TaxID=253628 RepID=A0A0D2B4K8_9PEZI|nr:uncharacterized protein PV09_02655 [Verruconis gallopava]KIW06169.1 hypothetical protein PV09_02655 [Verruconis gallopava]